MSILRDRILEFVEKIQRYNAEGTDETPSEWLIKNGKFKRSVRPISKCKICGSRNLAMLYRSRKYSLNVGECANCGFVFVLEEFSESQLREMYSDERVWHRFSALVSNDKVRARHRRALHDIQSILNVAPSNKQQRIATSFPRLFDVGAGSGGFLRASQDAGFEVCGNEFSVPAIRMARERHDILLSSHSLEQDNRTNYFDVITMWGLIEHVQHPRVLLEHAFRLLRLEGILYICTPVWCLYDDIGLRLARISGGRWTRLLDRRITMAHLQLFRQATLESALARAGFDVLRIEAVCEYNLPVVAYLESLGVPAQVRGWLAWVLDQLIDHGQFFRNNMRVFCRKR